MACSSPFNWLTDAINIYNQQLAYRNFIFILPHSIFYFFFLLAIMAINGLFDEISGLMVGFTLVSMICSGVLTLIVKIGSSKRSPVENCEVNLGAGVVIIGVHLFISHFVLSWYGALNMSVIFFIFLKMSESTCQTALPNLVYTHRLCIHRSIPACFWHHSNSLRPSISSTKPPSVLLQLFPLLFLSPQQLIINVPL
ncbi:hypothetical protein CAEBREN_17444 [Caenorhabditis brenneri]|uniref:Uncharacterized protein n=1 Tax=Caenorhabditis brenneri TaxID=135651 RepID=G0MWV7_CAEBE|nr:hypothetical protein CAEBREN_17444 [Caenorhabditis brenneri]